MRGFRDHGVDLDRLKQTFADQAKRERELDRIIAELVRDQPGNAEAVAAAGIANRAQLARSASMIEFGAAAVDALRRAGYLPVSIALAERLLPFTAQPKDSLPAPEPATYEPIYNPLATSEREDIPDDWAQA